MTNQINNYIEEVLNEFDKKFGIAGPEMNSDSIGRKAGCDDCQTNIEEREEHKQFLTQALQKQQDIIKECLPEEKGLDLQCLPFENSPEIYGNQRIEAYKKGWNECRQQLLDNLSERGINLE